MQQLSDSPVCSSFDISPTSASRFGATAADAVFVWLVWAAMTAAAVYFVARWSVNQSHPDDEAFAVVLRGDEPVTWKWFWQPHHEHRLVLPKLVMLPLFRLSGGDWRSGMYFQIVCHAIIAALLIWAVQRARGWTALADAFFPFVLLHWGYAELWLWPFGSLNFTLSTCLFCIVMAIVSRKRCLGSGDCLGLGACLAALAFCGGTGLVLLPPLVLWLLLYGFSSKESRRGAFLAAALAIAAASVFAVAFPASQNEKLAGLGPSLQVALELFSQAFGPHVSWAHWHEWAWLGLGCFGIAGLLAAHAMVLQPAERWRAGAMLACLAAIGLLYVAIGVGRGENAEMGLSLRYAVLATPVPCAVYLAAASFQRGRVGHYLQIGLLILAGMMVWLNAEEGRFRAEANRARPPARRTS